jgi:hypothetical protein
VPFGTSPVPNGVDSKMEINFSKNKI